VDKCTAYQQQGPIREQQSERLQTKTIKMSELRAGGTAIDVNNTTTTLYYNRTISR